MKNIIKYILQKTFGLRIYLFLFSRYVILKFPYDKKEKGFLRFLDAIDNEGILLDIGANIGVTSYYFSKKKPGSQIFSFEPIPDNLEVLKNLVAKYKLSNVKVCPYALGDKNGTVEMVMPAESKVLFHGLSHVKEINPTRKGKLYTAEIKRLDDLDDLKHTKIAAIKLDVEEYEYNVLKGGERLISQNRPLVYCELWESDNRKNCFEFFDALNYKTYIIRKKLFEEYSGQAGFHNFLFVPVEFCNKFSNA